MELDDLLEREGIDAAGVDDMLAWARERADQLVASAAADDELAALLDGRALPPSAATPSQAQPAADVVDADGGHEQAEATLTGASPSADSVDAAEPAPSEPTEHLDAEGQAAEADADEVAPEPQLDPLAGIDFDGLPGLEEDDPDDGGAGLLAALGGADDEQTEAPDSTSPSMEAPLSGAAPDALDVTERALNPLQQPDESPAEAPEGLTAVTEAAPDSVSAEITQRAMAPVDAAAPDEVPATVTQKADADADDDEEEIEEIELLDDDDFELMDEDEDDQELPQPADDGKVPEWQAALTSAQLGGGAQADADSGLLEMPGGPGAASQPGQAQAAPADESAPVGDAPQAGDEPAAETEEAGDEPAAGSADEADEPPADATTNEDEDVDIGDL